MIRIAAAGDIHASPAPRDRILKAFEEIEPLADVILLAGDLTTAGEPEQAQVVADACRRLSIPVFAVLGNHDWNAGKADEVSAIVADAGVHVLDRSVQTCEIADIQLGAAGRKGFIGGSPAPTLPAFGEPLLRELYAETGREAEAIARGLLEIVRAELR